jgi:hypothetical protein
VSGPQIVEIVREDEVVVVIKQETGVAMSAPGPQGARGPQGPAGAPGGSVYEFVQSVPSSTWVINHNIGRHVAVILFDDAGTVVQSDIDHGSTNQATVTWSSPTTGTALVL